MNVIAIRSVLTVCATLAIALLPLGSGPAAQGKGTVKIATQSPLSGGQAALGEGIKLGAQLGMDRVPDRHEWIEEGEFIVIPRGVEHKPVAEEECWILLFEPGTTLNTGNVVNERTWHELERV